MTDNFEEPVTALFYDMMINIQLYSLVENNLHRHTRFHYRHFHPLTAQVNRHDSYRHCKHKDMLHKACEAQSNAKDPEVQ